MPRIPRYLQGGGVAHVLSRGNNRAQVFHNAGEYFDFIMLLDKARARSEVDLFAFCLMPNHFHLVVRFDEIGQLTNMMRWWLTAHVARYRLVHSTSGHIWQGRFKSFPIQEDEHMLTVLRYVLVNPCRAGLARSPHEWQWNSLHYGWMIKPWPIEPAGPVADWLQSPISERSESALAESFARNAPFGDDAWREETAKRWGLLPTLRSRGKQRSAAADESASAATY
jgi:putative transposase